MDFNFLPAPFHFAEPVWLWGLALVPLIWLSYILFYRRGVRTAGRLKDFADAHLLPHLLAEEEEAGKKQRHTWPALLAWSLIWACGLLALAGPRWDYTEVKAFAPARDLLILLDLSRSMDAQDIKPSRLARARQEIEDILKTSQGTRVGLIAFDTVPHLITPLTDDKETLNRLLPYMKTDLVYVQGSYLAPALEMAGQMLKTETGDEKNVLILSDGGFDDGDATILQAEQALRSQGVRIYVMGTGTAQGVPIPDGKGGYIKQDSTLVFSRLEESRLKRVAGDGGGFYEQAGYLGDDTQTLLSGIQSVSASKPEAEKTTRYWEERFYVFLLPFALLILPWFRRNAAFPVVIAALILTQSAQAHAFDWDSLFLNKEQQGEKYVKEGQYDKAVKEFDDPYRKGVSQYKSGNYKAAAESFQAADRPEIRTDARYNLGNAQLMSGRIEDAVKTYEDILKSNPDHTDAQHNLEIAKQLLEKQQKNNQDQKDQNNQQQGSQDNKENQDSRQNNQAQNQPNEQNSQRETDGKNNDKSSEEQKRREEESSGQQGEQNKAQQAEENKEGQDTEHGEQRAEEPGNERTGQPDSKFDAETNQMQYSPEAREQTARTQKDINADQWLNRIENDAELFLKNKFYIESQRYKAKEGENPW